MKKPIEEILDICLEKIGEGIPLEEVLRRYPDYAHEVKELLAIARDIKDTPSPEPSERGMASCLVKLGEALQLQKEKPPKAKIPRLLYFPSPAWAKALVFIVIIIFISWGTVTLSANSLPGDFLYPIKLITEQVKFFLIANPEGKVELRLIYSEERMQELVRHLDKKRELNTQLLKAMLDEATLALQDITRLPERERPVYYSRLEHLNAYQKDVLENLKSKVISRQQKEELENTIQMCGNRRQWMGRMRRREVSPGKWGPHCGGR
ncbi:MAG: DUF5667 domain-containing protein [bacterium]